MKNFETILNTGEDAANYITVDYPNEFTVFIETISGNDHKKTP